MRKLDFENIIRIFHFFGSDDDNNFTKYNYFYRYDYDGFCFHYPKKFHKDTVEIRWIDLESPRKVRKIFGI